MALSEGLLITIGGLFGGGLIAWSLSQMLIKVLTGVFDPPPSIIAIPWGYLTVTVLAVVAALSTAAMVSARASTRQQSKSCGTCERSVGGTAAARAVAVGTIWLMDCTQAGDRFQVLVIEDDETIGQHLQSGLQGNGYDASWCRTGGTRLTLTRESPPRSSCVVSVTCSVRPGEERTWRA